MAEAVSNVTTLNGVVYVVVMVGMTVLVFVFYGDLRIRYRLKINE